MTFLELIITKACNQSCYYCNVYDKTKYSKNDKIEVDLDFIDYVIKCHDFDLYLEISGGEPGLVSNLDEMYHRLVSYHNVKRIRIMSNGLVRLLGIDWIDDIDYCEHLIYDIKDRIIFNLYENLKCSEKYINVIVCTPNVVESLLNHFVHFRDNTPIFNNNYWLKIMNPKTINFPPNFDKKVIKLYEKLGKIDEIRSYFCQNDVKRRLCAKYPYLPAIDVEAKKYLHCGAYGMVCESREITKENVELNRKGKLFQLTDYCKQCYIYNNNPFDTFINGYGNEVVKNHVL